jgi:hypothetical protein
MTFKEYREKACRNELYQQLMNGAAEYELFSSARLVKQSAKGIRLQLAKWGFKVRKSESGEMFIPKEGVIKLIKYIDTEPCWEAYNQLWADSRELQRLRPELARKNQEIAALRAQVDALNKSGTVAP